VETEEDFPRDVVELQRLLGPATPEQKLVATPGAGTNVPIWLLGSSLFWPSWPPTWACPMPLPRTSRRACSTRPCSCTAACSSLRPNWPNPM
jgi:hypothetical protein